MADYKVSDTTTFLTIAADLDKSLDPYERAAARAIRAILPALDNHTKAESLLHWHNDESWRKSQAAFARIIGIGLYLGAKKAALAKGNLRQAPPILEEMIRQCAESALEQLKHLAPPATNAAPQLKQ